MKQIYIHPSADIIEIVGICRTICQSSPEEPQPGENEGVQYEDWS